MIRERLKECWQGVLSNTIYEFIKFILEFILGGGLTYIVGDISIAKINSAFLNKYRIPIIVSLIALVGFVLLERYNRGRKFIPSYPLIESDYEILEKNVTFTYGRDMSYYELYLKVRSNIKGLNRIHGKYTWSGSEEARMRCITKNCQLRPLIRKDSFIEYEVELNRSYKKNKQVECTVVGELPDREHKFIPFFSTRITEPTKLLIVNICIPNEYNVKELILEEIAVVRNANEDSRVVLLDANGRYQWKVENPKLFYKYSVRWVL